MNIKWRVPPVFRPLLKPARYKGAWGGRGSGKSHYFAGHAVVAMLRGKNVLCVREIQNSIQDSVKRLMESKIEEFGLDEHFESPDREIRCKLSGGLAIFRGMQNHTAKSVKSLEGFDIAWWEEAQTASQRSLDLLTPTIRTPGSELWFSWNPEDETDPVDQLLRADPPAEAVVIKANWQDNPWFPEELRADMERDKRRDPDKAAWIWEGAYRTASEARIFRNYRVADLGEPEGVVWFYGVDWGFSVDPLAGVRCCFVDAQTLYISHDLSEVGVPMERYPTEIAAALPGIMTWPSAADSARPEAIDYCRRHGLPRMVPALKGPGSVEDGIVFLQGLDIVLHPRCAATLNEFNRYSYKQDPKTNEILPVPVDAWNHCVAEGQRVLTARGLVPIERVTTDDRVMTRAGLRRVLFAGVTDADREVLRVETTLGDLVCTPDHLVFAGNQFVRADALRYGDEVTGDASWLRLSRRATESSPSTATAKSEPVHGRVLGVYAAGRCDRVYDLTVEDAPEFYAEGVLVHNCLDALRYACERAHRKGKLIEGIVKAPPRVRDYGIGDDAEPESWKVA